MQVSCSTHSHIQDLQCFLTPCVPHSDSAVGRIAAACLFLHSPQTGLSHKEAACTASPPDDSQQRSPTSCPFTPLGCACGLQTSQPNEADNLISWDEPQTYYGDAVKGQVFGQPHAALANSAWGRSMSGPAQVAEQQDVVEAEAGALLCTAALLSPHWCGMD